MDNGKPVIAGGEKCARQLKIDWKPILACTENENGGLLLAMHGNDTQRSAISNFFIIS
jgi:hypothetical protein